MKTAFLTFEQFHGKKDIGSSRIRAHWVVKYWQEAGVDIGEAEIFRYGANYDAVIFQKAYFLPYAKAFKGVKILDLCDPDWFDWGVPLIEMINEVDAITCSSMHLVKAISKFTDKPVYFVPDRVDLGVLPEPKKHIGPTKKIVWFGYPQNFSILNSAIKLLSDLGLELIVISTDVYIPPAAFNIKVTNYPWSANHMKDIQSGDVVINPKHGKGKWKFKSDNKTSISQALGMPVAHDADELKALLTEEARVNAATEGLAYVKANRDVKDSVVDYKDIIQEVLKGRVI